MKIRLYAIMDRIAEEAGPIYQAKSDAVAIRNFRMALKEANPDEFRLYYVGDYDTEKVKVFGLEGRPEEILVPTVETKKEAK